MNHFSVVLLPEERTSSLINNLKLRFNQNGFRYKITNTAKPAHITMAHGYYENDSQLEIFKEELTDALSNSACITINDYSLITDKRVPNKKANYINYWVAFKFSSYEIDQIVEKIEGCLVRKSMSETNEYIITINAMDPTSKTEKIVGDHMNLCNYCRENKLNEAISWIDNLKLESILFDRVGIMDGFGQLIEIVNL